MPANEQNIVRAARLLQQGQLVAFPTETVYGLGAVFHSAKAVRSVYKAKRRPQDNPLIVHIADRDQIDDLVASYPDWVRPVLDVMWPGPLTVVLPRADTMPDWATCGLDTIAVRCPDHQVALRLLRHVGEPVFAPSANLSGKPSPTQAKHVMYDFSEEPLVAAVLDAGVCRGGIESTVLLVREDHGVIVRRGQYDAESIEHLARVPVHYDTGKVDKPLSPGQKYRHYAPKAQVVLSARKDSTVSADVWVLARFPQDEERLLSAYTLYAILRDADEAGVALIHVIKEELDQDPAVAEKVYKIIRGAT